MRTLAVVAALALGLVACKPPETETVSFGGIEPTLAAGHPIDTAGTMQTADAAAYPASPTSKFALRWPGSTARRAWAQAGPRLVMPFAFQGRPGPENRAPPTVSAATAATCEGLVTVDDAGLMLDGQPVFLFGVNAQYLLDNEFPEGIAAQVLADISQLGVNTVRVWYFHQEDPDRFERLLDLGAKFGLRFVVTLEDNVFVGKDWFFGRDDEKHYRPHLARTVERFRNRPEIVAWELINEPNCGDGGFDDGCVKTIRDWLVMASRIVREIDPCRPISTGLIGAGNFDNEKESYGKIQGKADVDMASVHRRTDEEWADEADLSDDDAIFFGEVYDRAYGSDCQVLSGSSLTERADRVKDDLSAAISEGADGYVLWDYAAGAVRRTNGDTKYYCSEFGYDSTDPLWDKLKRADLPPRVPWQLR